MEDTPSIARAIVNPQTQSNLYSLTKMRHDNLTRFHSMSAPIHAMSSWVLCDRHGISSQYNPRADMDPHDESHSI